MLYAKNELSKKITAKPLLLGFCPGCRAEITPKCGMIKRWHWSHKPNTKCNISKSESAWQLEWKSKIPIDNCEVVIEKQEKLKLADCQLSSGKVIEFEDNFSLKNIQEKESFYNYLIWVFDGRKHLKNIDLLSPIERDEKTFYVDFLWHKPKRSIKQCEQPIFFDFGFYGVVRIKNIYNDYPFTAGAILGDRQMMIDWIYNNA